MSVCLILTSIANASISDFSFNYNDPRQNIITFEQIKYVPLPVAMGTCPDDPQTFFMQQYRWAMGSATLVLRKDFWRSNISSIHKICFLNGMLYYTATAVVSARWK